ncbi:uncharacterized protein LOC117328289 [Pecten maximus]|uniref:uncharacterized protein LOC117328289 n=1 Tax=Pecten maximus TaxID=6579 RepID=UPI001458A051|nr:uncharacterized protein LOC117328289 [Pecten maximus]
MNSQQCPEFHSGEIPRILRLHLGRLVTKEDRKKEVGDSVGKSFMCRSNSPGVLENDLETKHGSSTGDNFTEGYTRRPPTKKYVYANQTSQIDIPGFLYLNTGMKIKQKIYSDEQEVAFGWYRPHSLAAKCWGFYLARMTSSISSLTDDHAYFTT